LLSFYRYSQQFRLGALRGKGIALGIHRSTWGNVSIIRNKATTLLPFW
jgi:hypothetical protein